MKEGPEHKTNLPRTTLLHAHPPSPIHVSGVKKKNKKKIKECRNHIIIHLRQRIKEQTCQVRVWIGRAGLQQGYNYIQTSARVHPTAQQRMQ